MEDNDSQARYPIRTVSQRTGLSPHVLRAWERRYGVVDPARSEGGGRLYSNADIFRLRLLSRLTGTGHAIGTIARLPTPELLALLRSDEEVPAPAAAPSPSGTAQRYVEAALRALEGMEAAQLHATLMRAVVALPSQEFVDGVVIPLLHRVGGLWEEGRICPAHEHVLSAQVSRVLGWLADTIPVPPGAPNAVAVTPAGQRHEFGALLASVVAAEEGWRVTYLGADLPAADIATAVKVRSARAVLLSAVLQEESADLLPELRELRSAIGGAPGIFVGGRGAASCRAEVERAGGSWLRDLGELRVALRALHSAEETHA